MKKLLLFGGVALSLNAFSQTAISQSSKPQSSKPSEEVYSNAKTAESTEQTMMLYPNPAVDFFEVIHSLNQPIDMLSIRDKSGRRVRTYEKPKPEKFFIADLDLGVYTVDVTIAGNTYVLRLEIP